MRDRLVIVAAPTVARPDRGASVPGVLLANADAANPWKMITPGGVRTVPFAPVLKLSSLFMVRDAVRAGAGAGLLPLSMVLGDVARGTLLLWGDAVGREVALWALYTSPRLLSLKVSAFLDHLAHAFPLGTSEELAAVIADS